MPYVRTVATSPDADPNAGFFRALLVAPMKSAGTYVSASLCRYVGFDQPNLTDFDWNREHSVDADLADRLRGRSFCMNFHMLPSRSNLEACLREKIRLVGLWRNLADMLVSLDEHLLREGLVHGPFGFSVVDAAAYTTMPQQDRYAFLIDAVLPWYLGFYVRWRHAGLTLHAYEHMLDDQSTFFTEILYDTFGHRAIPERLASVVATQPGDRDRFNVGRIGRGTEQFHSANRRRLEERLLAHPQHAQLEVLLWELPWEVPALARVSPLDGRVVRTPAEPTPHFVSRGVAYPVRQTWLDSRFGTRRTPELVEEGMLALLPRGEALS
jgi:hypothetical protein